MTQVNNPQSGIIDKLIQQNGPQKPASAQPVAPTATVANRPQQAPISQDIAPMRVVSARYRVYALLLLFAVAIFGYNFLLPTYDSYQGAHTSLTDINLKVTSFTTTRAQYESNKAIVDAAETYQSQIVDCMNIQKGCNELPDLLKNNISLVRAYLQLQSLTTAKMGIDEKLLLANINEYLLKTTLSDGSKGSNGMLRKIAIGEKEIFNEHISYVPIQLTVTFVTKDGLLSFIGNVEKYIIPETEYRVFYKIDKISYDIVDYQQPQDAEIFMYAYSYN